MLLIEGKILSKVSKSTLKFLLDFINLNIRIIRNARKTVVIELMFAEAPANNKIIPTSVPITITKSNLFHES